MIDRKLIPLKKIFDQVETYDPSLNVGMRSLKNLGVWLVCYALTEERDAVIRELIKIAKLDPTQHTEIKKMVEDLSSPENLKKIILSYERAFGTFSISVSSESIKEKLCEKATTIGIIDLIHTHTVVGGSSDLTLTMSNVITFAWQPAKGLAFTELSETNKRFNGIEIPYLSAFSKQHNVSYRLEESHGSYFHVVSLGALQSRNQGESKEMQSAEIFLIEPVLPEDQRLAKENYYDIIHDERPIPPRKLALGDREKFLNFKHAVETFKLTNVKFSERMSHNHNELLNKSIAEGREKDLRFSYQYTYTIHFPALSAALQTKETRLGIYSVFTGKTIGNQSIKELSYIGERELSYDRKGGKIKNKESLDGQGWYDNEIIEVNVEIEYTVISPYLFVYSAGGSDHYPFFIANPIKDLQRVFTPKDTASPLDFSLMRSSIFAKRQVTETDDQIIRGAEVAEIKVNNSNAAIQNILKPVLPTPSAPAYEAPIAAVQEEAGIKKINDLHKAKTLEVESDNDVDGPGGANAPLPCAPGGARPF